MNPYYDFGGYAKNPAPAGDPEPFPLPDAVVPARGAGRLGVPVGYTGVLPVEQPGGPMELHYEDGRLLSVRRVVVKLLDPPKEGGAR